jgi:hypothetical protein
MTGDRRFFIALLAVAAIAVAVMPLLFAAEDPQLQLHRQRIAAMTRAERERLERNFDRFTKLSEAERERYRAFHAALAEDRTQGQGRLDAALETFLDWLASLPPYERDLLQREQDPAAKIALLREALQNQREVRLETRLEQRIEERLGPLPLLKQRDLEAVTAVLADASAWPAIAPEELEGYDGLRRTLKLFELLGRRNLKLMDALTNRRMRDLLEAISDEPTRDMLQTDAEGQAAAWHVRRRKIVLTLWKNLELALDREARRSPVTDQTLMTFFAGLPREEQEEFLELPAADFRRDLTRRYIESESLHRIEMRFVRRFLLPGAEGRARALNVER